MVDVNIEIGLQDPEEVVREKAFKVVQALRPEWANEELKMRRFSGGITNMLVGVGLKNSKAESHKDDLVLLRVYGQGTDELIDRGQELAVLQHFQTEGKGPRFYGTFSNGLAYAFVPGLVSTTSNIRSLIPFVAVAMAQHHSSKPKLASTDPCLWSWLDHLIKLAPSTIDNEDEVKRAKYKEYNLVSKKELEEWLKQAKEFLATKDLGSVCFCHNDLLLANIVYNEEEKRVEFIDHEYGNYNYKAFDLANHFEEFVGVEGKLDYGNLRPDANLRRQFISKYLEKLEGEVDESRLQSMEKSVNLMLPMPHLVWGIWSLVQSKNSTIDFDFYLFAAQRLGEFVTLRNLYWKQ